MRFPWPKPLMDWSLRSQLAFGAAIAAVLGTLILSVAAATVTLHRLRDDAGAAVQATALQMGEILSRGMFERFNDIYVLANLNDMADPAVPMAEKRKLLENLQSTFPAYAWIGLADNDGKVLASTGGLLEGVDVSQRPWFIDGRFGTTVKDVHDAKLLAKLLPPEPGGAPLRLVDVATPLRDKDDHRVGVLGAHLSWSWASDVRDALLRTRSAGGDLEIMIVAKSGAVLLGPTALVGQKLDLASVTHGLGGAQGHAVETWPDGKSYLTGYGTSPGYGRYPGLGWVVLVRQPAAIAFAPADEVQAYIIGGGVLIALCLAIAGWFAARRVTRPLLAISESADRIASADEETIPDITGSREVNVLGRSLRHLLDELRGREKDLRELNFSLEERVVERTESLRSANADLQREIELRKGLEKEREALISELRGLAETDPLSGLFNRRAFMERAQREFRRAQRQETGTALVMLDLDHFKVINDQHGHPAGDAVLRATAKVLRESLRDVDIIGRLGGEEFAVMLTDSNPSRVPDLAERLRRAVAAMEVVTEAGALRVTTSLGYALAGGPNLGETKLDDLIKRADAALYRAKAEGRNRVAADDNVVGFTQILKSGTSRTRPS